MSEQTPKSFAEEFQFSHGRMAIYRRAAELIGVSAIKQSDDAELKSLFLTLVQAGDINGGAVTGLVSVGHSDRSGNLTDVGVETFRRVATDDEILGNDTVLD